MIAFFLGEMCGFDVEHASVALKAPGKRILVSFGESLPEWTEREPGHTLHNGLAFLLSFWLACELREARCTSLSLYYDQVADAEGRAAEGRAARSGPRCRRPGLQRRSTRGCLTTHKWTVRIFFIQFLGWKGTFFVSCHHFFTIFTKSDISFE